MKLENILFLDVETSIYNKGNPFDPRNFLVSYVTITNNIVSFKYYTDPDFNSYLQQYIKHCDILCGFNIKFDFHWLWNIGVVVPPHVKIWDLQLAEFIYSGQSLPYDSLDDACSRYGLPRKPDVVKSYWDQGISTELIPVPILEEYNIHDVESNVALYKIQQELLSDKQKKLVFLEGEDLRSLQAAEAAGIKYDVENATKLVEDQASKIADIEEALNHYLPPGIPDGCFNYGSGDHLSAYLYGGVVEFKYSTPEEAVYKSGAKKGETYIKNNWHTTSVQFPQRFQPLEGTEVSKTKENPPWGVHFYQTDRPTLQALKATSKESREILQLLQKWSAIEKVGGMAQSLIDKITEMHWDDNLIHPNFNQNVVVTGRLSSSSPNMQNQPPEVDCLLITRYNQLLVSRYGN